MDRTASWISKSLAVCFGAALAAFCVAFGGSARADITFDIIEIENVGEVRFEVSGSLNPAGLTDQGIFNSPPSNSFWTTASGTGFADVFIPAGQALNEYGVSSMSDTGSMNGSTHYSGTSVITGTPYAIGGTHGAPYANSIVLNSALVSNAADFTVQWTGATLADFGLTAGQSRVIEFDDGAGGRQAIVYNVSAVSEFINRAPMTVPAPGTNYSKVQESDLYPSEIVVSGISEIVTDVNITLYGVSHTHPDDINIILQGPTGQAISLWADSGGHQDLSDADIVFDDEAPGEIPAGGPMTAPYEYQVSYDEYSGLEQFPGPAPSGIRASDDLSVFDGLDPNGTWRLFVVDDGLGDTGEIAGGWSITFETAPIPEPTSLALLGLGGLAILGRRRPASRLTAGPGPAPF